ncbi:MAG: Flavinator of succinate dehydrogenase [Gammaproteobacteria bacterium]|nr:Flavinator of succinate dehydrogenase [Gammaproteobacteria bacterium]
MLLERYVRSRLAGASSEERQVLTRLLELPDPVLSDYLLGHAVAPDPPLAMLVAAIRGWTPARANVGAGAASVGAGAASVGEYR